MDLKAEVVVTNRVLASCDYSSQGMCEVMHCRNTNLQLVFSLQNEFASPF